MMTFNIGSQTAGVINNVAGDQRITGGQQGTVVTAEAARQAVMDLRNGLATTPLDEAAAADARAQAEEIDAEMQAPQPDRSRVAGSLERLTSARSGGVSDHGGRRFGASVADARRLAGNSRGADPPPAARTRLSRDPPVRNPRKRPPARRKGVPMRGSGV